MAETETNGKTTALQQFAETLEGGFDPDHIDSFWTVEPALAALARSGSIGDIVNAELRKLLNDPAYIGDWQSQLFVIQRGPGYALALILMDRARRYIHSTPYLASVVNLSSHALSCDVYEFPAGYRNDVFDPTVQLNKVGSVSLRSGDTLAMRGLQYVYDLRIEQPTLLLQLSTAPCQTMEWLFSRDTLFAWQANDSEVRSTQARVAAYLLGRIAHPSSLEPLSGLLRHPHHAVRWAAIQAIGRLSRTAALIALEQALNDPHPHIRHAADRTLKALRSTS